MWYSSQSGMPKPVFWRKTIVMTSGLSFSQRSYPLMVFLRPELFTPQLHSLFVNKLNSLSFWHHETLDHRLVSRHQRIVYRIAWWHPLASSCKCPIVVYYLECCLTPKNPLHSAYGWWFRWQQFFVECHAIIANTQLIEEYWFTGLDGFGQLVFGVGQKKICLIVRLPGRYIYIIYKMVEWLGCYV